MCTVVTLASAMRQSEHGSESLLRCAGVHCYHISHEGKLECLLNRELFAAIRSIVSTRIEEQEQLDGTLFKPGLLNEGRHSFVLHSSFPLKSSRISEIVSSGDDSVSIISHNVILTDFVNYQQ